MILHRQGTQPRLIVSSGHSSINLNLRKRNSVQFSCIITRCLPWRSRCVWSCRRAKAPVGSLGLVPNAASGPLRSLKRGSWAGAVAARCVGCARPRARAARPEDTITGRGRTRIFEPGGQRARAVRWPEGCPDERGSKERDLPARPSAGRPARLSAAAHWQVR